jgi:hypothetical protein
MSAEKQGVNASSNSELLYRFEVTYFDRVDWDRVDFEIIARNYQEALIYVENKCPLSSRIEPYSDGEDSLKILEIGRVKLPIEI